MFSSGKEKPIGKWGGFFKGSSAKLYADGRLEITSNSGSLVEVNIHDITAVTLRPGGFGKSKVALLGTGIELGETKALPVSRARELKKWIEQNKYIIE